tara:strand:- start:73 stop:429 length:357 start_codon:yes stop_codon:yes gene_type:complete
MRVALIILTFYLFFFLGLYEAYSKDECHDFKVDVMICLNEGADATYARYGREYKGTLPRTEKFTMCRLKKSEWWLDEKTGMKDDTQICTYQHPQGGPDIKLNTGPRYDCPRNIECKVR